MIGNNPREMGCLSVHLRNFAWKRFLVNATFDLTDGWRIAQYYMPDYVLIDGGLSPASIKEFVERLRSSRPMKHTVVAILKESNDLELIIPGVEEYLLKDSIASDTFAFDVLNAISRRINEREKSIYQVQSMNSKSWISQLFGQQSTAG
jgi:DNA-binding response OmpR family regulator